MLLLVILVQTKQDGWQLAAMFFNVVGCNHVTLVTTVKNTSVRMIQFKYMWMTSIWRWNSKADQDDVALDMSNIFKFFEGEKRYAKLSQNSSGLSWNNVAVLISKTRGGQSAAKSFRPLPENLKLQPSAQTQGPKQAWCCPAQYLNDPFKFMQCRRCVPKWTYPEDPNFNKINLRISPQNMLSTFLNIIWGSVSYLEGSCFQGFQTCWGFLIWPMPFFFQEIKHWVFWG